MRNRLDYILTISAVIAVILTIHILHRPVPAEVDSPVPIERVRVVFPDAVELSAGENPLDWIEVKNPTGETLGRVVVTSPHSDHISGYGGAVSLLIAVNPLGEIHAVTVLEHSETPRFMEQVESSGFFRRWDGIHWKDVPGHDVDSITGATMTCNGVKGAIIHRLSLLDPDAGPGPEQSPAGKSQTWKEWVIILLALTGTWLGFWRGGALKKLRYLQLALSVIFLGFAAGSALSMTLLAGWITDGIPPGFRGIYILALLALAVPVIAGRNTFCYFVCPFGAFQEMTGKVLPWKIKIHGKLDGLLRHVRYGALLIITLSLMARIGIDINSTEPFSAFLLGAGGPAPMVIALVSLVLSVFLCRPWCRYGCALGALLDLLKRPIISVGNCPGRKKKETEKNLQEEEEK